MKVSAEAVLELLKLDPPPNQQYCDIPNRCRHFPKELSFPLVRQTCSLFGMALRIKRKPILLFHGFSPCRRCAELKGLLYGGKGGVSVEYRKKT